MADKKTKMTYIKLFLDYLDAIEELCDAERGRLFTALLEYGRTGTAQRLVGNERFVFSMMKKQIDRDNEAYEVKSKKNAENGSKGAATRWKNGENGERYQTSTIDGENSQDKDKEKEKEKDYDKDEDEYGASAPTRTPVRPSEFIPPTAEEVRAYCAERKNTVNPERFVDYYSACGWMMGKNAMKDWRAAVRIWESNDISDGRSVNTGEKGSTGGIVSFDALCEETIQKRLSGKTRAISG